MFLNFHIEGFLMLVEKIFRNVYQKLDKNNGNFIRRPI